MDEWLAKRKQLGGTKPSAPINRSGNTQNIRYGSQSSTSVKPDDLASPQKAFVATDSASNYDSTPPIAQSLSSNPVSATKPRTLDPTEGAKISDPEPPKPKNRLDLHKDDSGDNEVSISLR